MRHRRGRKPVVRCDILVRNGFSRGDFGGYFDIFLFGQRFPVVDQKNAGIDKHSHKHGGEDAQQEFPERDVALDCNDQVLGIADGSRGRADVGVGS